MAQYVPPPDLRVFSVKLHLKQLACYYRVYRDTRQGTTSFTNLGVRALVTLNKTHNLSTTAEIGRFRFCFHRGTLQAREQCWRD